MSRPVEERLAEAVELLCWAHSAIAPFSKEPAEQSGIARIRRFLAAEQVTA